MTKTWPTMVLESVIAFLMEFLREAEALAKQYEDPAMYYDTPPPSQRQEEDVLPLERTARFSSHVLLGNW